MSKLPGNSNRCRTRLLRQPRPFYRVSHAPASASFGPPPFTYQRDRYTANGGSSEPRLCLPGRPRAARQANLIRIPSTATSVGSWHHQTKTPPRRRLAAVLCRRSQLRMVARMICTAAKVGTRRQVFFVSMGGFDKIAASNPLRNSAVPCMRNVDCLPFSTSRCRPNTRANGCLHGADPWLSSLRCRSDNTS